MDAFYRKTDEDLNYTQETVKEIHELFKEHVIKHRGDKLTTDSDELDYIYNSNIFLGDESLRLGLVDKIGDYKSVLKREYPKLKIQDYSDHSDIIKKDVINSIGATALYSSGNIIKNLSKFINIKH